MKRALFIGLFGFSLALSSSITLAQDTQESVIKYRQTVMRTNAGHLGALSSIVKGEIGYTEHMSGHAAALAGNMEMLLDIFPDGSGSGFKTRALPAIWEDQAKFAEVVTRARAEAAKLVEVVESGGDAAAIGAQVGELGKNGCGACHTAFRGPAVN